MAGTDPRFNATKFRDAIHFAMAMGQPTAVEDQLTFTWNTRTTFAPGDENAMPYDWTENPATSVSWGPVTIPCAFQFKFAIRTGVTSGPLGEFEEPQLLVTLLDTEYAQIFDPDNVRADAVTLPGKGDFQIMFVAPPEGLFDVTVYTIYCQAIDVA